MFRVSAPPKPQTPRAKQTRPLWPCTKVGQGKFTAWRRRPTDRDLALN